MGSERGLVSFGGCIRVWGGLIKGASIIRGLYKGLGWAHKGG